MWKDAVNGVSGRGQFPTSDYSSELEEEPPRRLRATSLALPGRGATRPERIKAQTAEPGGEASLKSLAGPQRIGSDAGSSNAVWGPQRQKSG
jgi:hypothetical protein